MLKRCEGKRVVIHQDLLLSSNQLGYRVTINLFYLGVKKIDAKASWFLNPLSENEAFRKSKKNLVLVIQ